MTDSPLDSDLLPAGNETGFGSDILPKPIIQIASVMGGPGRVRQDPPQRSVLELRSFRQPEDFHAPVGGVRAFHTFL